MLSAELLNRLGVFLHEEFLDRKTCESVAAEMLASGGARATLTIANTRDELDERYRRTTIAEVSPETVQSLRDRIDAVRPALEQRFDIRLGPCEKPQFLLYREGDFIVRHSDGSPDDDAPDWLRKRAVSVLVYLNDQSDDGADGTFAGGAIAFYGLLARDGADPRADTVGLPVVPTAGLLVAFGADVDHEVLEVTAGARCAVVTWFPTP